MQFFRTSSFLIVVLSIAVLVTFGALIVLGYSLVSSQQGVQESVVRTESTSPAEALAEPMLPPFTDEVEAQLAASDGFEALVSYTDAGFEPADIAIDVGDTIRFTNNSRHTLRIIPTSANVIAVTFMCSDATQDACTTIERGAFREVTFNSTGTWGYRNEQNAQVRGVIRIETAD